MMLHSICRLCSACCPVEVLTERGQFISAKRKSVLPKKRQLNCPKLNSAADIIYSPERLLKPLIKNSNRRFRESSWDEAMDIIAERLLFSKKEYGPRSVCWLRGMAADWGAPWDYVNRLMNAYGSPNSIGNGSICFVGRDFAHTSVYGAMTIPQTRESKCILIWGKNDKDTAPNAAENILLAKENGAKLIVVDPIKTRFAQMADLWLQIRPAHDGLLAMAIIHEIIHNSLYDTDFVDKYTVGFDDLKKTAERYTAERVAKDVWLDAELIKETARLYTSVKPACIVDGNGLDMQLETFDATRAVAMLRALSGNLDIIGGDHIPETVPHRNLQLRERLPASAEPITSAYLLFNTFHAGWGNQVQSCVIDAILDEKPYPLKTLIVQSGNPAVTFMDAHRAERALEKVEFLAVIDMFMNRTAEKADVILPAGSCFEHTQLNRAFIRSSPVKIQEQVIAPVGESRPNWHIIFDLARRIGLEKEFPWQTAEEAIDYQLEPSGITVAMLREHPEGIMAKPVRYRKYETNGFMTPSGKVEFSSELLKEHGHNEVPFSNGHQENPISFMDEPDQYPVLGMSGDRDMRFVNSQFRFIPSLLQRERGCMVDIHPEEALKHKISTGDWVQVETPRGHIQMKARISDLLREGTIRIAWGWGDYNPDYSLNRLTDDNRRNPVIGTASGRNFMCRIKKL
ncbi:MAG: molybdopterin-dependent oxidoreductase [Syntrophales bacterium]|jgi:anaerobic selenocysteine-containing dehydrogenase|nr:molybdopterin-dependent oxidoreductase [Syntrophales bacterium]MDY0045436.1 molybdopterin-dependent oxidoreductase [Syntrophales bacterium]